VRGFSLSLQTSTIQSLSNFAGGSKKISNEAASELEPEADPLGCVEDVGEARTKPGPGRVSTRRGWAGDKVTVFSSLL
jgi:hypothetical protein